MIRSSSNYHCKQIYYKLRKNNLERGQKSIVLLFRTIFPAERGGAGRGEILICKGRRCLLDNLNYIPEKRRSSQDNLSYGSLTPSPPTHPPTHPHPPPHHTHTHPGSSSSVLYRHSRGLLCQTDTRLASIMPWQTSKNLDRFTLEIQRTFVVKPRCKTITLLCKESSENILRIPLKVRAISARIIY